MAEISPFPAYRYDLERVQLANVVTQPYDKITPAMQQAYAQRSAHNLITIEKGRPEPNDSSNANVYTHAAAALDDWIRNGILVRDATPGGSMSTPRNTPFQVPPSGVHARASSHWAASRTIPPASCFGTNKR